MVPLSPNSASAIGLNTPRMAPWQGLELPSQRLAGQRKPNTRGIRSPSTLSTCVLLPTRFALSWTRLLRSLYICFRTLRPSTGTSQEHLKPLRSSLTCALQTGLQQQTQTEDPFCQATTTRGKKASRVDNDANYKALVVVGHNDTNEKAGVLRSFCWRRNNFGRWSFSCTWPIQWNEFRVLPSYRWLLMEGSFWNLPPRIIGGQPIKKIKKNTTNLHINQKHQSSIRQL